MNTYVVLVNWTDKGVVNVRELWRQPQGGLLDARGL